MRSSTNRSAPGIAAAMSLILALPPALVAQAQAPPAAPAAAPTTQSLRLVIMAGRDGENDLEARVMSPLAVQVLDLNDRPVEGATVTFRFPINGPSAAFPNNQLTQTVRTDASGQARATGWTANTFIGPFTVQVTASRGSEQGSVAVPMSNVPRVLPPDQVKKKRWWSSKWAKIGYVAAAAGIITAVVLTSGNGTTIRGTPGTPTVGGPQ